jgi:hypothetical protein
MSARDILGLPIPEAGPVFAAALVIQILSGLTAVASGAVAATAKKRPGRHPRAGRIYLWALGGVFATATVMAVIRWREDAVLFAIALVAFGLGIYGYQARRRHRPGWPPHHAIGGSCIALLTGFYVDNGPFLPLWKELPHITLLALSTVIGVPLIWLALYRFGRSQPADSSWRLSEHASTRFPADDPPARIEHPDQRSQADVARTSYARHLARKRTGSSASRSAPTTISPM